MIETPKFKHDCKICSFLGSYQGTDLYEHKGIYNTVVSRYGDSGEEYESGLDSARNLVETNPTHPLAEAYRRSSFFENK